MEAEERPHKIRRLSDDYSRDGLHSVTAERINYNEKPISIATPAVNQADTETVNAHNGGDILPFAHAEGEVTENAEPTSAPTPLSKNQLKKLCRQQQWEQGRADRKAKRKEKIKEKRERKRAVKLHDVANTDRVSSITSTAQANGSTSDAFHKQHRQQRAVQLPITFIFDCDFDELMLDKERISLASQLTRCYADNRNAHFRAHLVISSFKGKLRERFDGVLAKHYESWKGVRFFEDDFVTAATQSLEWMRLPGGGKLAGVFTKQLDLQQQSNPEDDHECTKETSNEGAVAPDTDNDNSSEGEVVYLTSDSPNTLTSLHPYSTYIIGGLVDRNRHKGICYKRALDRGINSKLDRPIKTAKLPIGQFLEMNSRFVLATNHVSEIMLRWLECGNWGEAFMKVLPKRKGGALKAQSNGVGGVQLDRKVRTEDEGESELGDSDRRTEHEAIGKAANITDTQDARLEDNMLQEARKCET